MSARGESLPFPSSAVSFRKLKMYNFVDWKKQSVITGIYVGQYKSVGAFKKNVFLIQDDKNIIHHIWAYKQLTNLLYGVPFKTRIKITNLGRKPMPENPAREFIDFEIEVLEPVEIKGRKEKKEK